MLFAVWKLKGIGKTTVSEDELRRQMTDDPVETFPATLTQLQSQGFIEIKNKAGPRGISITPLGVAILRKVEEDRLEEVK
jgi:hypothetical protein